MCVIFSLQAQGMNPKLFVVALESDMDPGITVDLTVW